MHIVSLVSSKNYWLLFNPLFTITTIPCLRCVIVQNKKLLMLREPAKFMVSLMYELKTATSHKNQPRLFIHLQVCSLCHLLQWIQFTINKRQKANKKSVFMPGFHFILSSSFLPADVWCQTPDAPYLRFHWFLPKTSFRPQIDLVYTAAS